MTGRTFTRFGPIAIRSALPVRRAGTWHMKPLTSLRLVCNQCKARNFEMTIFASQTEVDDWERSQSAVVQPSF
jgi:hypothetical protein